MVELSSACERQIFTLTTWRILKAQTESGSEIETKIDNFRSSPVWISAFIAS